MPEEYEGDDQDNLSEPPAFFPYDSEFPSHVSGNFGELVRVQVDGIFGHDSNGKISHFVVVSDGERRLPIIIGPFEATSIQLVLENSRPDRPLTHDLTKALIERLDSTLDRVVIDDFWNTIYYAKLYLKKSSSEEEIEVDARPSDAIALAVRFDCPIFVADGILEHAMDE